MVQLINILWNNSFINLTQLPLLCRNFRAVALEQPGLTAGRQAGRQAGWLAGWLAGCLAAWLPGRGNAVKFQILKFIVDQIFELFAAFNSYSIIRTK